MVVATICQCRFKKGPETLSDETPDTVLKSALEKIVYFEARSTQLSNDSRQAHAEVEHLRAELAQTAQREIELRRVIAELEVRVTRAHSEREEMVRVADALRRERADLISKMLDASRIQSEGAFDGFDLSQFIAQLRSEVLLTRDGALAVRPTAAPPPNPAAPPSFIEGIAGELKSEGRLDVTSSDLQLLAGIHTYPGRSEETLFGFSVRELSSADAHTRIRAAERLKALGDAAAAPALATALNQEGDARVQIALLGTLASMRNQASTAVIRPLLSSTVADVRIAALKALLTLDPSAAVPHLAAAVKDPDKAVRRRATLLALGLKGEDALKLGREAISDVDPDVRALAALVLGASRAESSRSLLLDAMRDPHEVVRRSAGQALSKMLGRDVTQLVALDDMQRKREVRRIAHLPDAPAKQSAQAYLAARRQASQPRQMQPSMQLQTQKRVAVAVVEAPARAVGPEKASKLSDTKAASRAVAAVLDDLRISMRGRPIAELASNIGASVDETMRICGQLIAQGAIVRRGLKYFVA